MEQREKLLAGGLGAAVALWVGLSLYDSQYKAPLEAKDKAVVDAEQTLSNNRSARRKLLLAQKTVRDSLSDSLPPDRIDAQRLYGNWCYSLAELSGWSNLTLKADSTAPLAKIGWRIPVTLSGQATRSQLATFIDHFQQTDLLHRIDSLDVVSASSSGDPAFTVVAQLEGVSLNSAPQRGRLFPEARLAQPLTAQSTTLEVERSLERMTPPFRVRVEREYLTVTAVNDTQWTVERGVDQTTPAAHEASQTVQVAPLKPLPAGALSSEEVIARIVSKCLFVKPTPPIVYKPKLASTVFPPVIRGVPWTAQLKADGWNPTWPKPSFRVAAPPEGLTVSPAGEVTWTPPAELPAGEFKPRFLVLAGDETKFETEVTLTLRDANRPPKFDPVQPFKAFVGRALTYDLKALDEDADTTLVYALAGTVPPGMTIDASTGQVAWTPPETQEPGEVTFQVTATDNGSPQNTATQDVRVQVADDHAQFTFLIGSIEKDEQRVAWLFDRLANTKSEVRMGDKLRASEMEFTIDSVDSRGIAFRMGKQRLRLELGQQLREAKAFPPESPIPPPPPKNVLIKLKPN